MYSYGDGKYGWLTSIVVGNISLAICELYPSLLDELSTLSSWIIFRKAVMLDFISSINSVKCSG